MNWNDEDVRKHQAEGLMRKERNAPELRSRRKRVTKCLTDDVSKFLAQGGKITRVKPAAHRNVLTASYRINIENGVFL